MRDYPSNAAPRGLALRGHQTRRLRRSARARSERLEVHVVAEVNAVEAEPMSVNELMEALRAQLSSASGRQAVIAAGAACESYVRLLIKDPFLDPRIDIFVCSATVSGLQVTTFGRAVVCGPSWADALCSAAKAAYGSVTHFARAAGYKRSTVHYWARGEHYPRLSEARQLSFDLGSTFVVFLR